MGAIFLDWEGEAIASATARRPALSEPREREGEAPSGFAGGGGDASPMQSIRRSALSLSILSNEEIKLMGAHYGIIWSEAREIAGRSFGSPPTELMISSEKGICFMRPIQKDYLILLIFGPSGNWGQARRWIQWASDRIIREI